MKRHWSRRKRITLWTLGMLLVMLALAVWRAGYFLAVAPNPAPSQAIIVLSGEEGRLAKGLEVFQQYGAEALIISSANDHYIQEELRLAVLPPSGVYLETQARSTKENAAYVRELMNQHGLSSAIVVTSDFHMRRARYLFEQTFEDGHFQLTYASYESPQFSAAKWWSSKTSLMITGNEYIKLGGNWLGIDGKEAKRLLKRLNKAVF
ncbi:YdcF family protein [Paenibacillus algorifonticola]|uniref:YdcF family protein n=1 Tax=Paenibacillus algorifonticola TaxID=684063 RepID=UPI003D2CE627